MDTDSLDKFDEIPECRIKSKGVGPKTTGPTPQ